MERFVIGKGLVILCQGHTLQFSRRRGSAIQFKDAGSGQILKIDEHQFWREVEQREISVMARALKDAVPVPAALSAYHDRTAAFGLLHGLRYRRNTERMFGAVLGLPQVELSRSDREQITLIANIIRDHVTDLRRIPVTIVYGAQYLSALRQMNIERARDGLEVLQPMSLSAFRRRVAKFTRMHNSSLRTRLAGHKARQTHSVAIPPGLAGPRLGPTVKPHEPGQGDVEFVPIGHLQVTAVVDRASRCVLELRIRLDRPSPNFGLQN